MWFGSDLKGGWIVECFGRERVYFWKFVVGCLGLRCYSEWIGLFFVML